MSYPSCWRLVLLQKHTATTRHRRHRRRRRRGRRRRECRRVRHPSLHHRTGLGSSGGGGVVGDGGTWDYVILQRFSGSSSAHLVVNRTDSNRPRSSVVVVVGVFRAEVFLDLQGDGRAPR